MGSNGEAPTYRRELARPALPMGAIGAFCGARPPDLVHKQHTNRHIADTVRLK